MAKPRHRTADFAVYLLIRLVGAFLRALPFSLALRFASGLAWLLKRVSPKRVRIARDNVQHAFPGQYDEAGFQRLVEEMYQHFCRVLVEIMHLDRRLTKRNWRDRIRFGSAEMFQNLSKVLLGHRPIMAVSAHFGNWEVASFAMGLLGFPGYAIARPLDNPHLDRWMRRWRESSGQKMIAKNGEFHLIEEALRRGGILGTIGDQDAGSRGLFVPFFNRPASTHKAIALLAMEHKPLIMVSGAARLPGEMTYCIYIEDVIDPLDYENRPDAVKAITVRFTEGLERMIRRHPEQYFWVHRRWKHQPAAAKKQAA